MFFFFFQAKIFQYLFLFYANTFFIFYGTALIEKIDNYGKIENSGGNAFFSTKLGQKFKKLDCWYNFTYFFSTRFLCY